MPTVSGLRHTAIGLLLALAAPCALPLGCDAGTKSSETTDKAPAGGAVAKADVHSKAQVAPPACDTLHGKTVEQEILRMCKTGEALTRVDVPQAPWKVPSTALPHDARFELGPGRLRASGRIRKEPKELLDDLAIESEMAERLGRRPQPWSLEIAQATPTSEVAAVFKVLADAGHDKGRVVVTVEASGMPKPRLAKRLAELDEQAAGTDAGQRAVVLARQIENALPPCPDMHKTFAAIANVDPAMKCRLLARGISEALVTCDCPKEDELLTLIYAVAVDTAVPERSTAVLDVTLDPKGAPRDGATWGEVMASLDEASLASLWLGS